ncbi:80L [Yaba monkey tumor virus]|uniref:80L n=1 Tax=Yaba monkey tumor virus (strain VR587) TaxID=928314 RepID=Q6TUT5_YMTV5|nr:putative virion structural protein [Yaba monkey tumor virus]AAR07436.1 80L [Yaba monkey tumor virus]
MEQVKKINSIIQNCNAVFLNEINLLFNEHFIFLERNSNGLPFKAHVYNNLLRFDNKTIFRAVKFIYGNRPQIIKLIFPNNSFFESLEPLLPVKTVNLYYDNSVNNDIQDNPLSVKIILLDLFNSFKIGKKDNDLLRYPHYYLPLRKNINDVIT